MTFPVRTLVCGLALAGAATALPDTGSVCVAPLPKAISQGSWHPLTGTVPTSVETDDTRPPVRTGQFRIRIDSLAPVPVRTDSAMAIGPLGTKSRHRVAVTFDGRAVASFPFRFASHGSADLCLWYHGAYESWILEPRQGRAHGCVCK